MHTDQNYEQTHKPLPGNEAETLQAKKGSDYLKRILPNIERISLTDEDPAKVKLNGPKS